MSNAFSGGVTAPTTNIAVNTPNGHGSVGTTVRTWANVVDNGSPDITYTSDAVNGDKFTINTKGTYAIDFTDHNGGSASNIGITINASGADRQNPVSGLSAAVRRMFGSASTGVAGHCTLILPLNATDVIRLQDDGSNTGTNSLDQAQITRII